MLGTARSTFFGSHLQLAAPLIRNPATPDQNGITGDRTMLSSGGNRCSLESEGAMIL